MHTCTTLHTACAENVMLLLSTTVNVGRLHMFLFSMECDITHNIQHIPACRQVQARCTNETSSTPPFTLPGPPLHCK